MFRYFFAIGGSLVLLCSNLFTAEQQTADPEAVFSEIYYGAYWYTEEPEKRTSGSGPGSMVKYARPYMDFLEQFLKEKKIKTVVDLGCGDWEFSQHINWGDVEYRGYDVVEGVIRENTKTYGNDRIHFIHADILKMDIPEADLLLCKDVLIHLPNKDVKNILEKTNHIKYRLFTNCRSFADSSELNSQLNKDIPLGKFRVLDLSQPPFEAQGKVVFRYKANSNKEVFLMER